MSAQTFTALGEAMLDTSTDTGAAFAAGAAVTQPTLIGSDTDHPISVHVVPGNYRIEPVDPADFGNHPRRYKARNTVVTDVDSFIHGCDVWCEDGEQPAVYIDTVNFRVIGILNDDAGEPGHRDRQVTLQLRHTPEWDRWVQMDQKLMGQHEFAEFVEDNLPDIAEPTGADLLEVVSTLEATVGADFRSSVVLKNGAREFQYAEKVEARAGATGSLTIPDQFTLGLAPWVGSSPFAVTARLRYRISDSGLRLGFRLQHTDRLLREAFDTDVMDLIHSQWEAGVVNGTP